MALCASGGAQNVSVVQDNVGNAGPVYYCHERKVARTSSGLLMATWNDKPATVAGGQVYYATYDDAFQSWSPATAISNAADRAIQSALAADESGNIRPPHDTRCSMRNSTVSAGMRPSKSR
jgi:TPP-dependent trihydroxycyclohexane-1,2-dione (THcHDO) dehydratase